MANTTLKASLSLPQIDKNLTVPQFLSEQAQFHAQNGKSVWMIDSKTDEKFYFKDFDKMTKSAANWLYKNGMKEGDVLIYLIYNFTKEHLLFNGVWRANGILRASYPQDTKETLLSRVVESQAKFLFCEVDSAVTCLDIAKNVQWDLKVIVNGQANGCVSIDRILEDDGQNCPPLKIKGDDPALILCTSGTTGKSKGAVRTHSSILSTIQSHTLFSWSDMTLLASYGSHISGSLFPMGNLAKGVATLCLSPVTNETLFQAIHKYKPTFIHAFPTFLLALVNHEDAKKFDFSSIHSILTGGVIITPAMRAKLMELPGLKYIFNMYGLTETIYSISNVNFKDQNNWELLDPPLGFIGKVLPNVSLQIRDLETGQILGANQKGEICLKSRDIFSNYINAPQETTNGFTEDGWFKTGDIGSFNDDEYVTIHGRVKEIFKYFNFHISPSEIDQILSEHPAIAEACTIGVVHSDGVNLIPRAFVTLKIGQSISSNEIIQFANEKLADYKHLRGGVIIVPELPKGSTGKVQRSLVAQMTIDP